MPLSDGDIIRRMANWRPDYYGADWHAYSFAVLPANGEPITGVMHARSDREAKHTVTEWAIRFQNLPASGLRVTVEREDDDDWHLTPV